MSATLWGVSVGDVFRSSWYGTARRYRVLSIDGCGHGYSVPIVSGERRPCAELVCLCLAESAPVEHSADTAYRTLVESEGDPPMELGKYDHATGAYHLAPMAIIERANVQLDLFAL